MHKQEKAQYLVRISRTQGARSRTRPHWMPLQPYCREQLVGILGPLAGGLA
jgi:hypothetical protein